jgi:hypothetical protein
MRSSGSMAQGLLMKPGYLPSVVAHIAIGRGPPRASERSTFGA